VKIDDKILKKPGILTEEEFAIIKKHTEYGYEILNNEGMKKYSSIALSHHEFIDGSGYPQGLKNDEINYYAKIVQICDIFEALTGIRPYKKPFDEFPALRIIRGEFVEVGKIDKKLFEEFVKFIGINEM
jgi:HD-GYP domain-containing protein (c-di-GMP phosphodiesterase class II)